MRVGTISTLVACVTLGFALLLPQADAAFPGKNGKIVFDSRRDSNDEIYVMNADGSGQTRLTNTPEDSDVTPSFSADGSRILFASDRDAALYEIYVMNAAIAVISAERRSGAATISSGPEATIWSSWASAINRRRSEPERATTRHRLESP